MFGLEQDFAAFSLVSCNAIAKKYSGDPIEASGQDA